MNGAVRQLPAIEEVRRRPGAVDLFAFSAAIGMAHRIHFDADYARDVEGHPTLLVQGPLQAAYMLQAVDRWARLCGSRCRILTLTYRHLRPVYLGQELVAGGELTAWNEQAQTATLSLWVMAGDPGPPATTGATTLVLDGLGD